MVSHDLKGPEREHRLGMGEEPAGTECAVRGSRGHWSGPVLPVLGGEEAPR